MKLNLGPFMKKVLRKTTPKRAALYEREQIADQIKEAAELFAEYLPELALAFDAMQQNIRIDGRVDKEKLLLFVADSRKRMIEAQKRGNKKRRRKSGLTVKGRGASKK